MGCECSWGRQRASIGQSFFGLSLAFLRFQSEKWTCFIDLSFNKSVSDCRCCLPCTYKRAAYSPKLSATDTHRMDLHGSIRFGPRCFSRICRNWFSICWEYLRKVELQIECHLEIKYRNIIALMEGKCVCVCDSLQNSLYILSIKIEQRQYTIRL